jgi:hypothetical protein
MDCQKKMLKKYVIMLARVLSLFANYVIYAQYRLKH